LECIGARIPGQIDPRTRIAAESPLSMAVLMRDRDAEPTRALGA
jgi:hypothetical protein